MIGIVIVSHSANLATALVEMAQQMTPDCHKVLLEAAGGIDVPRILSALMLSKFKLNCDRICLYRYWSFSFNGSR